MKRVSADRAVVLALGAAVAAALGIAATAHPGVLSPRTRTLAAAVAPLPPGAGDGSVDLVDIEGRRVPAGPGPVEVPAHAPLHVVGWAIDPRTGNPPNAIEVRVEGEPPQIGILGIERPDVVAALNRPGAASSGFSVAVSSGNPGRHAVQVFMLAAGGRRIPVPGNLVLDVHP
jgi:hypothetical protein